MLVSKHIITGGYCGRQACIVGRVISLQGCIFQIGGLVYDTFLQLMYLKE